MNTLTVEAHWRVTEIRNKGQTFVNFAASWIPVLEEQHQLLKMTKHKSLKAFIQLWSKVVQVKNKVSNMRLIF